MDIMTALAVAVPPALALGALVGAKVATRRAMTKQEKTEKTRVSVTVTQPQRALFERWAELNGMTLYEWIRRTLLAAIPDAEKHRSLVGPSALDRAFEALDQTEDLTGGDSGLIPLPPVKGQQTPTDEVRREVEFEPPKPSAPESGALPLHPCVHLSRARPRNFAEGECQGLCAHRQQEGRVCFWTPSVAKNCVVFEPRVRARLGVPTG